MWRRTSGEHAPVVYSSIRLERARYCRRSPVRVRRRVAADRTPETTVTRFRSGPFEVPSASIGIWKATVASAPSAQQTPQTGKRSPYLSTRADAGAQVLAVHRATSLLFQRFLPPLATHPRGYSIVPLGSAIDLTEDCPYCSTILFPRRSKCSIAATSRLRSPPPIPGCRNWFDTNVYHDGRCSCCRYAKDD